MAHFLCHLGCSHFGALLLDFYFTENRIEQNFKGEYEQIGGKKIYISENIDQTVYLWSEDLMLYTIYSVADADENYKIILSVKE